MTFKFASNFQKIKPFILLSAVIYKLMTRLCYFKSRT
uniref:Uncharacterized protein n=1 Tax=Rhizophora mucronata TaxID=61149 RepID=A0A2P2NGE6_RHIMU